ncbi:PIG-L deacetylase family protein [Streptomyces sp. CT34]|uniref:PIG-L deacetylase family protein n=1 Tax=Streptomyces sp. CT34 TaxID=1553907 RepID=UPI0005BB7028|nr:PIG-L deacetylase family protein [Streptomyces sp. CT34]
MAETSRAPAQLAEMPTDWQRALAIVAHPDDLEYGVSAAIATWTDAGRDVVYVLATLGEAGIDAVEPAKAGPLREQEQRAGAAAVGVTTVEFLGHPDGVIEYGTALRRDFAAAIRHHRPELVLTLNHHDTWGGVTWNTPDHRAVGRAVLDAVGDAGNRWIFPELVEDGLVPWNGVRYVAVAGSPKPTHAVDAGPGYQRAVRSLMAHRSYIEALTGQDPEQYCRSFLNRTLHAASARFDGRPAVPFELFTC